MSLDRHRMTRELILDAESEGLLVRPEGLTGYSSDCLAGMLQRLARHQVKLDGGCYLEIGVFQGRTLVSTAMAIDGADAFGIDNFSIYDPHSENRTVVSARMRQNMVDNAHLIDMDYEDALADLPSLLDGRKVALYFVDGPHDYRSQLLCLEAIRPNLTEHAVIVVDDCNYRHVRLASHDFLRFHPEFKLLFEAYTPSHPANISDAQRGEAWSHWWNGVNVIVRDPEELLTPMYPEVPRDRRLYENDHLVHAAKHGIMAPEAVALLSALLSFRPIAAARMIPGLFRRLRDLPPAMKGEYPARNTYSAGLSPSSFNPTLLDRPA